MINIFIKQQRNYSSLLNALAIVGGFIKSLMVGMRFITKPFSKTSLNVSLLNDLFSFNDKNRDDQNDPAKKNMSSLSIGKKDQEVQENKQLNHILNQEIYNERKGIHENKEQQSEAEKIFRKFMRIDQKTLRMTFLDYIKCLFVDCCKYKKGQIIKTSKKKVNERLDIVYILKKLVEIDKLKILLLNDQQRRVFDYLPKPLVTYNNYKGNKNSITYLKQTHNNNAREEWSLLHTEQTTLQKAIQAVKSFQNIMKQETSPLCMIDLRLIEMLDAQIVKKFSAIQLDSFRDYGGMNGGQEDSSPKNQQFRNSKEQSPNLRNQKIFRNSSKNEMNFKQSKNSNEQLQVVTENNQSEMNGNEIDSSKCRLEETEKSIQTQQGINDIKPDEESESIIIIQNKCNEDHIQQSILNVDNFHGFIYNNLKKVSPQDRRKSALNVIFDHRDDKQITQFRRKSAFNFVREEKAVGQEELNQDKVKLVSQYLQQREIQKSMGLDQPPSPYMLPIQSNMYCNDKLLRLSDLHVSNALAIKSQNFIPENPQQGHQPIRSQKTQNSEDKRNNTLKVSQFYELPTKEIQAGNFLHPIREQSENQDILMPSFGNLIQNSGVSNKGKEQVASQSLVSPRVALERSSIHGMNPSTIQNSEKHNKVLFSNSLVANNLKFLQNEQFLNSFLNKEQEQRSKNSLINSHRNQLEKQTNLSVFNSQSKILKSEQNQTNTIHSLSSNSNSC